MTVSEVESIMDKMSWVLVKPELIQKLQDEGILIKPYKKRENGNGLIGLLKIEK